MTTVRMRCENAVSATSEYALKREADDHSPDALRQRRLYNFGIRH